MSNYQAEKKLVLDYFDALETTTAATVSGVMDRFHSQDCHFYGCHPFNELIGPDAVAASFWAPLLRSFSSLQRRQDVFIAGTSEIDEAHFAEPTTVPLPATGNRVDDCGEH